MTSQRENYIKIPQSTQARILNQTSSLSQSSSSQYSSSQSSFLQSLFIVEEPDLGKRLDIFLQEKLHRYSRSQVQEFLGGVRVNGESKKKQYRVRNLDRVELDPAECKELSKLSEPSLDWCMDSKLVEKLELEILYEDEYLLVLNKPSGVVVHPSRGHLSGTLCHALSHKLKGISEETKNLNINWNNELRPGVVHRLDKDTSGLMLWAKDPLTQSRLCTAFQKREVKKEYLALVHGETPLKGEFSQAIGLDPKNRIHRSSHPNAIHPKEAKTLYRRINFYPSPFYSSALYPSTFYSLYSSAFSHKKNQKRSFQTSLFFASSPFTYRQNPSNSSTPCRQRLPNCWRPYL